MATYAFVIGIDQYASEDVPTLSTPVGDALRMAAWLATKGGVPLDRMTLLLGPVATEEGGLLPQALAALPGIEEDLKRFGIDPAQFRGMVERIAALGGLKPATHNAILGALAAFPRQTSGGERLYFYYAGHGLASRVSFSNEDAIVPADYEKDVVKAIGISSIVRFFQPLAFPEQFFFLDCCRNLVLGEEALDSAPVPRMPDLSIPAPDQFIFNATAPGLRALDGRGMLTDLLLDGLMGKGKAKEWDRRTRRYVVRPRRLFEYIREQFDLRSGAGAAIVGNAGGTDLIQKPRLGGERNSDPDVVAYPEADLPPVRFSLRIAPGEVAPIAQVRVTGDNTDITRTDIRETPVVLELKPRIYTLSVALADQAAWEPTDGPWTLDVYDPDPFDWPVVFLQKSGAPASGPGVLFGSCGPGMGSDADDPSCGWISPMALPGEEWPMIVVPDGPPTVSPVDPGSWPGRIVVEADDPLAHLELVAESSGGEGGGEHAPRSGTGTLDCPRLEPGFYRARLRLPEGPPVERPVELKAGQKVAVRLAAPLAPTSRLARDLMDRAGLATGGDDREPDTGGLPGVAAPSLSTLLALSGGAASRAREWGDAGPGLLAMALGPPPGGPTSGEGVPALQVLLAVEPPEPGSGERGRPPLDTPEEVEAYLRGIEIRSWPLEGTPGPAVAPEMTAMPGIAQYASPAAPGPRWLDLRAPSGDAIALATCILEGRTIELILHEAGEGPIRVYQFLPGARPDEPADPELLRRLDLGQRFLRKGQVPEALAALDGLTKVDRPDPIAGCLGGHLLIRGRHLDDLARLGETMVSLYPGLPDAHVLLAFHREAAGDRAGAAEGYRRALDAGLPIASPLLRSLAQGAARVGVDHPRRALLDRVAARLVPGLLWTAWSPDPGWPGDPGA